MIHRMRWRYDRGHERVEQKSLTRTLSYTKNTQAKTLSSLGDGEKRGAVTAECVVVGHRIVTGRGDG